MSKIEGLNSKKIKQGDLSSDELKDLKNFTEYMENIPLHIEDSPALTIPAIRNLARRFKRQHNIGLIVIDHLGIIENNISSENRVQEISKFSRALKGLAKELKVPVILLSQLNRGVESRDNKRPWLSDLRDSGSIEQDADVVIFPYREKYYENRKKLEDAKKGNGESISFKQTVQPEPDSDVLEFAEIIIAKHRDGEVGTVNVLFDSEKTTFRNAQK